MRAALLSLGMLVTLPGCSLLFPEDPRVGDEPLAMCQERLQRELPTNVKFELGQLEGEWVPTYTFDISKLSLDEIQALSVAENDETLGTRMTLNTNENSTAREQFMQMSVTEDGALFLTGNPALYRVRGEPVEADQLIASGCESQQTNMRFISLSWEQPRAVEPEEQPAENENENNS